MHFSSPKIFGFQTEVKLFRGSKPEMADGCYDFERLQLAIGDWRRRGLIERAGDCWLWRGPVGSFGYASAKVQGIQGAHRVMWVFFNRRNPNGVLRNECGNHLCVRAGHWRDEVRAVSRLQVRREIMRKLHGEGFGIGEIAERVGCSRQSVSRFVRGLPVVGLEDLE